MLKDYFNKETVNKQEIILKNIQFPKQLWLDLNSYQKVRSRYNTPGVKDIYFPKLRGYDYKDISQLFRYVADQSFKNNLSSTEKRILITTELNKLDYAEYSFLEDSEIMFTLIHKIKKEYTGIILEDYSVQAFISPKPLETNHGIRLETKIDPEKVFKTK